MTYRAGRHAFLASRAAAAATALGMLAMAGCASSGDTADMMAPPALASRSGGPIDTGTYPNLNIAPKAATAQFSDEESQAKLASLQAARARQSPGGVNTVAQKKRLQLLADENEANTLKVIESR